MDKKQTLKNLDKMSDEVLIGRILTGEQKLFEVLIHKYNDRLFRIGMTIINNNIEVEDIMQTVYVNAYENLSKFKKRSSFGTWIIRIMINESLLQLKRKQRYVSMEVGSLEAKNVLNKSFATQLPSNFVINKELTKVLENALLNYQTNID